MRDKLKIGLIAGGIATVFKEISNILELWIIHSRHTYWDYAGYIALNKKPHGFELAAAIFIQIFFSMFLAVIYTYGIQLMPTKLYKTRGSLFGGAIWFILQGILFVYKIPKLTANSPVEAIWQFMTAIIFGVIVSWIVEKLNKK